MIHTTDAVECADVHRIYSLPRRWKLKSELRSQPNYRNLFEEGGLKTSKKLID